MDPRLREDDGIDADLLPFDANKEVIVTEHEELRRILRFVPFRFRIPSILFILSEYLSPRGTRDARALFDEPKYVIGISNASTKGAHAGRTRSCPRASEWRELDHAGR